MAFFHSPHIITKGLVFYIDATNFKSYPESGDTCYSLVQNKTATLINNPSFNKTNYGEFIFDGSTRYIQITRQIESIYSSSIWFKVSSTTGIQMLYGQNTDGILGYIDAFIDEGRLSHQRYATTWHDKIGSAALIEPDNIYNVVFTVEADTSINVYLNGKNVNGPNPGNLSVTTGGALNIFTRQRGSAYLYTAGSVYAFSVYNRILTAYEVLQNYKALQGRFG